MDLSLIPASGFRLEVREDNRDAKEPELHGSGGLALGEMFKLAS